MTRFFHSEAIKGSNVASLLWHCPEIPAAGCGAADYVWLYMCVAGVRSQKASPKQGRDKDEASGTDASDKASTPNSPSEAVASISDVSLMCSQSGIYAKKKKKDFCGQEGKYNTLIFFYFTLYVAELKNQTTNKETNKNYYNGW